MLTQPEIDLPGRYFPVAPVDGIDLPIREKTLDPHLQQHGLNYERYNRLPRISKDSIPVDGFFQCFYGDRSECIPGGSIVSVLRRQAKAHGKPVEIVEFKPAEGRAMRFVGKWLLIGASLIFGIPVLIWIAKGVVR